MKLTALVLWVGAISAIIASLALAETEHPTMANLLLALAFIATPTGLIVYCIGQATEVVLDRIDQAIAIGRREGSELEPAE